MYPSIRNAAEAAELRTAGEGKGATLKVTGAKHNATEAKVPVP